MKTIGICMATGPEPGCIEVQYDAEELASALQFVERYVYKAADEYDGDLDQDIPEEVLAAAVAFTKASRVLHFAPGAGVQWLIDTAPYEGQSSVRAYAEEHLGMEPVEKPIEAARSRMNVRRAAAEQRVAA